MIIFLHFASFGEGRGRGNGTQTCLESVLEEILLLAYSIMYSKPEFNGNRIPRGNGKVKLVLRTHSNLHIAYIFITLLIVSTTRSREKYLSYLLVDVTTPISMGKEFTSPGKIE